MKELSVVEQDIPFGKVVKYDNGLLVFSPTVNTNIHVTLSDCKQHLETYIKLNQGLRSPYLCKDFKVDKIDTDAKEFVMSNGDKFASAIAMVITKPITKFLFNVMLALFKTSIPMKSFLNEEEAIKWLNQFNNND